MGPTFQILIGWDPNRNVQMGPIDETIRGTLPKNGLGDFCDSMFQSLRDREELDSRKVASNIHGVGVVAWSTWNRPELTADRGDDRKRVRALKQDRKLTGK
jgi:hypothetical protein